MSKVFLTLLITFPLITSCAKMFAVGHENAKCEATEGTGVCAPMEVVWENRKLFENSYPRLQAFTYGNVKIKGEKNKVVILSGIERKVKICKTEYDVEEGEYKVCRWETKLALKRLKHSLDRKLKETPVPVRRSEIIQRIWIYPYVDSSGNLVEGHFIYVVVEKGKWLDEEGREVD
ncbi:MAG TPA: type IV conjugative transfer system protein TraV [Aquifex aeolicus]|nr:type IV conjugative transfer system protein TraV [Aquifex aeolicus]